MSDDVQARIDALRDAVEHYAHAFVAGMLTKKREPKIDPAQMRLEFLAAITRYGDARAAQGALEALEAAPCDQCYIGHDSDDCQPSRPCWRHKAIAEAQQELARLTVDATGTEKPDTP